MDRYHSWGLNPKGAPKAVFTPQNLEEIAKAFSDREGTLLPYGNGGSYGDSCLNLDQSILDVRLLNRIRHFDRATGRLECESGVLLSQILNWFVPQGWFLPVAPETKAVTLGGAIANDIHGKNHFTSGSMGHHLLRFALQRSDGSIRVCSPTENSEYFFATIGGLGLTGAILWAEIQLKPIQNPWIQSENIRLANLFEYFRVQNESAEVFEYTSAWIDCTARGAKLGRGVFRRGNHAPTYEYRVRPNAPRLKYSVPFEFPSGALNRLTLPTVNSFIYHRRLKKLTHAFTHYESFFFRLDRVRHWNRIYGAEGFYQYQCVIPESGAEAGIRELLGVISAARQGSFLASLKPFGKIPSVGMLSFPRTGTSLSIDFPNLGLETKSLFRSLDEVVRQAGGSLYPAKDASMERSDFQSFYPRFPEFLEFKDPAVSSTFFRRIYS